MTIAVAHQLSLDHNAALLCAVCWQLNLLPIAIDAELSMIRRLWILIIL